jgi:hypothetical protein
MKKVLSEDAAAVAQAALKIRMALPKSRRAGLKPHEAKAQGITSGVEQAQRIAERRPVDVGQVRRFFARFRGQYLQAVAKGLGPEDSKVIQAWMLWGGDPADEETRNT